MISHCLCVFEIEYIRGRPIVFRHLVEQLLSKRTCLVFSWFIRLIFHAAACKLEGHESPTTDNLKTLLVWGLCPSAKMNLAERTRTVYASDAFSRRPLSCPPLRARSNASHTAVCMTGAGTLLSASKGWAALADLQLQFWLRQHMCQNMTVSVSPVSFLRKVFLMWNG